MKFKIVKLNQFSGNEAGVYSVVLNNDNETLLNKFVRENEILFKCETKNILERLISIGSGGHKPKTIRALQEDTKLKEENALLKEISQQITQRIKDKDIRFTQDYLDFTGDLEFNDED